MQKYVIKYGQKIGLGLLVVTLSLFTFCILTFVSQGGIFNPKEMYISDIADIPGISGISYRIGMAILIPFRLFFLLYILFVFKTFGISRMTRKSILIFSIVSYLGILGMSIYSPIDSMNIHLTAAMIYFFFALFTIFLITISEYILYKFNYIIPFSSLLNLIAFVFFLATLILTLSNSILQKSVSTLAEWFIFFTQMIWLYIHSTKLKPKLDV